MDDLALLRLHIAWGADEVLAEQPVDRTLAARDLPPQPAAGVASAARTAPRAAAARARELAGAAASLNELRVAIDSFDGCALRDTANATVFAAGEPASELLLIGEAPSADDDRAGQPFAGAGGGYLDRMLASIGLDRTRLLITPLLPWRPPGDRPPTADEIDACLPFLLRLIALATPRRLVVLGGGPAKALGLTATRRGDNRWHDFAGADLPHAIPALVTANPHAVRRQPRLRAAAWRDLRLLRHALDADLTNK